MSVTDTAQQGMQGSHIVSKKQSLMVTTALQSTAAAAAAAMNVDIPAVGRIAHEAYLNGKRAASATSSGLIMRSAGMSTCKRRRLFPQHRSHRAYCTMHVIVQSHGRPSNMNRLLPDA